jgi:hypothetical protein
VKVVIYGLGAIGSNLLTQLAKQHPDYEFIGVDYDKVEERNIGPQAYFVEHVGMYKGDAMRVILSRFVRKPKYINNKEKVTAQSKLTDADLSIDCFDNTGSRKLLKRAKDTGIIKGELLHIGFSPFYTAECMWNETYEVPNDVDSAGADICTQQDAVPFIHFVVNAALLNLSKWLEDKEKHDFIITGKHKIKWL